MNCDGKSWMLDFLETLRSCHRDHQSSQKLTAEQKTPQVARQAAAEQLYEL